MSKPTIAAIVAIAIIFITYGKKETADKQRQSVNPGKTITTVANNAQQRKHTHRSTLLTRTTTQQANKQ
jgi:hypothetical protein